MRPSTLLKLLCLGALIISVYSQVFQCSGPCVARYPQCQTSYCDTGEGVCLDVPKDPLPSGCCVSSDQCRTADPLVRGSCVPRTNQCVYTDTSTHGQVCSNDNDCLDNPCIPVKCADGFCVVSSTPDLSQPGCCQDPSDCPAVPCRVAFCSDYRCSYQRQRDCDYYNSFSEVPGDEEPDSSPSSYSVTQYTQPDYVGGDWGFLALGIGILVALVCIFCCILAVTCIADHRQQSDQ